VAYLVGVLTFFSPYRFFPTDDLFFQWPFLNDDGAAALEQAINSHQPVYKLTLLAIKMIMKLGGQELTPAIFLCTAALSGAVIMLSLMFSVHAYARQGLLPLLAGVVFALSSWTATYFFFFSYGPLSSAFCMASIALLVIASRGTSRRPQAFVLCAGAGLLMGFYFWSSPSSPVLAGLALLLPFFLWEGQGRDKLFAHGAFVVSELVVIAAFGVNSLPALVRHLEENVSANWYYKLASANIETSVDGEKWQPILSFFQVALKVQAPVSVILFLSVLALTLVGHGMARKNPFAANAATRSGMLLACYFLAAGLLIDFLPTTKLGRTLFQLYPIMLLATFLLAAGFFQQATLPVPPKGICLLTVLALCLIGLVVDGCKVYGLYRARFALPEYLHEHFSGKPVYVIAEDSHAKWIGTSYLPEFDIRKIPLAAVQALVTSSAEEIGILIGPTEKNSSRMSIYLEPRNTDILQAEILASAPALQEIEPVVLPFSALHPAFLMENEITQALSLLGLTPRWNSPASGLKLYAVKGDP